MTERRELMIGDFARRSRLPISTLRYYDRIRLLSPALVDPTTGYRRYTLEQLPAATLIARLRALGVPPASIARILTDRSTAATVLLHERQRIETQIEAGRRRLRQLDELLTDDAQSTYDVDIVTLHPREVAALPFLLPAAELEPGVTRTIARLRSALRHGGHRRTGPWGATFPVDLADNVSGFAFAPVDRIEPGDLDTAPLPAGRALTTIHRGSPATLPLAYHAVFASLDQRGACPGGPVLEEYTNLDNPNESTFTVRICLPINEPGEHPAPGH
ncbi:MerR family transcriptional regulator [Pseudonocardia humida]|uniref:MerR family transcriptional regulator n=1 Tax=Pseudonocardia humida TaxID=2800819 RepID=A0ABT1A2U6_9PSEU|nr:MerR family transcriptional regulator [Pseudonocardia humida]MCO1657124.1 MerR family transcriptional regulator [Pseudonocardia humida]